MLLRLARSAVRFYFALGFVKCCVHAFVLGWTWTRAAFVTLLIMILAEQMSYIWVSMSEVPLADDKIFVLSPPLVPYYTNVANTGGKCSFSVVYLSRVGRYSIPVCILLQYQGQVLVTTRR